MSGSVPAPASPPTPARKGRPEWLMWAIGSGAFAAFNGVFAKLTTGDSTEAIAESISHLFGASHNIRFVEIVIRAVFFGFNLISNAIMWILFTRALTAATSTVRVSVLNTSANFMVTAVLGMLVFGEGLPLGWWAGASLLVAGSVVIGAREGKENKQETGTEIGSSGTESVRLQEGTLVACTVGAGGLEQDDIVSERFKDDPDKDDPDKDDPDGTLDGGVWADGEENDDDTKKATI